MDTMNPIDTNERITPEWSRLNQSMNDNTLECACVRVCLCVCVMDNNYNHHRSYR